MKFNNNLKISLFFLTLFLFLSILMLWPLPIYMTDRLFSPIDPLLNTWIMAWNIHQIQINPLNLFQANIFFPLANTLAFSEHLFFLSIITMPVTLISGNPILGYNFIQLLSFVLSGFTMYLLVYHLTKNRIAGFIAGIIFAFHPYRFRQIGHIQNIAIFMTPLCFLYLHKLIKKPNYKYMFLFTLFFVLQSLSCGYVGVFLSFSVVIAVLYYLLFTPKRNTFSLMKKLIISVILSALIIAPFLYPYLQVKKEFAFKRSLEDNIRISANIIGYTTISRFNKNVFYHRISRKIRYILFQTERDKLRPIGRSLFPGIITIFLVLSGFLVPPFLTHISKKKNKLNKKKYLQVAEKVNNCLVLFSFLLILFIIISGGVTFNIVGHKFSITHLTNPVYFFILFFILKLILWRYRLVNCPEEKNQFFINRNFYLLLGILTFILSFGPRIYFITKDFGNGPYMLFYKSLFIFEGIRVPERFGIIVMFSLSILAGYGMVKILNVFKNKWKIILCLLISGLLIYEFICIPLQSTQISREPKEVYKWLASDNEQYGILEYPFDTQQKNKYYMYWSIFHWKRIANGSTGYNPPLFNQLKSLAHEEKSFPNQKFIQYMKSHIPVKYLILHLGSLSEDEKKEILENAAQFPDDLKLVKIFNENDYVFEVKYSGEK